MHPDRIFPADVKTRDIARQLFAHVEDLPIVSPHGHTDPRWFASNEPFPNPVELLIKPDHYLYRMLYSQGIYLEDLGIHGSSERVVEQDPRKIWRLFCSHYHLFRATPSRMWLDHSLHSVFGIEERLEQKNADLIYDAISDKLNHPDFLPRQLFERFRIEVLCTTEAATDQLDYHKQLRDSGWYDGIPGRIITSFRPDSVVDPEFEDFSKNVDRLAEITGIDVGDFQGYLQALRKRRLDFIALGATSTDHGHPTARTANLSAHECQALYAKIRSGAFPAADAELFRAQMLTEMAAMSIDDGLVMQIHAGAKRNHNEQLFRAFGRDRGADIPSSTNFVDGLKPLLDRFGIRRDLRIILFTLDETTYSRELAPLAGHYPVLTLGPAWWFFDSVEGMRRYKEQVIETAGFYNTAGFNDDTRAFLSIPARHDLARRVDCRILAEWVADHRLADWEAAELAEELAVGLARKAYKLERSRISV